MYRVSQLMATPVANSSRLDKELSGELSPTCIFPSFASDFLDGDSSFECCSIDPVTGSHYVCRRSPRLLTNGYYIWTEDSVLCDPDGNITLNPSHTSVMYKENLVRIFRKKKRTHRHLSSLLDPRASKSWLHGSIFEDIDLPPSEDIWLEGIRSLKSDLDCSLSDGWESQKPITDTSEASSSSHILSQPLRESSQNSCVQPQMKVAEHFQKNILVHSRSGLMHKVSFQAILLAVCLIISACARWCMGGELANIFTCASMITIAYVVKSLFLNLASYFKATAYARFDSLSL
ncbi:transmembrane protein 71 isoform X1 [Psammomys obesus]|uniref:transmembrane protein 71 isoform X1 n=1 Tax=Psammomys obesus TaxID=48139 RepID=UPI002452DA44|nr:transmembrane protein 71 isoform X1 [Psammomys obesus]XP_055482443.1 transmembrane protein 71 isoform X1 [Psammomys obesus]XP_055482444.1 transmembrane protein 71 isoform X1 [Psammomys obesus]